MSTLRLEGTYTALVTPMNDDAERSIDMPALERLVDRQIAAGIDGLVACGTTGEASALFEDEFAVVVGTAVRRSAGRVPVLAGTGSNHTAKTIAMSKRAQALGVDGVLVVTPYYVKPTQDGLLAHYRAVADAVTVPVVLYNVPGRTACNLLPATVAELAKHPNIIAVKEASGSLDQVQEILCLLRKVKRPEGRPFTVLAGDDALCLPMYSVGGHGVISVVSNVAPVQTAALYRDYRAGRLAEAADGQLALHPLIKTLFAEPNPQPCKMALHLLGVMEPVARLPLMTAQTSTSAQLRRELATLGLLPAG